MERAQVESSNLVSVGYDLKSATLEIEFHSGGIYQYSGVSEDVHQGLMNAGSKGSYFHQNIKNAGYPYVKVG
jgi:hypothetical protein